MHNRPSDQRPDIRVVLNAILEIYRKEYANDTNGGFLSQAINTSKHLATKVAGGVTGSEKLDKCKTIDNFFSTHLDSNNSIVTLCRELGKIAHEVAIQDKQQTRFTETVYALIHYLIYRSNQQPTEQEDKEHSLATAFHDKREHIKKTIQNSVTNTHTLKSQDDEIDAIALQGLLDNACKKHWLHLAFLGYDFQDYLGKVKLCFPEGVYSYTHSPLIPDVLGKNYLNDFLKKFLPADLKHSVDPIIEFEILACGKNTTNQTIVQARKAQQQDQAPILLKQSSASSLVGTEPTASTPKILGGLQINPVTPSSSKSAELTLDTSEEEKPALSKNQKKKAKAKKHAAEEASAIGGAFEVLASSPTSTSPRLS